MPWVEEHLPLPPIHVLRQNLRTRPYLETGSLPMELRRRAHPEEGPQNQRGCLPRDLFLVGKEESRRGAGRGKDIQPQEPGQNGFPSFEMARVMARFMARFMVTCYAQKRALAPKTPGQGGGVSCRERHPWPPPEPLPLLGDTFSRNKSLVGNYCQIVTGSYGSI